MLETNEFWCPSCHACPLTRGELEFTCPQCQSVFPIVDNVPVLINDCNSVFAIDDYLKGNEYKGASYGSSADSTVGIRAAYRSAVHFITELQIGNSSPDIGMVLRRVIDSSGPLRHSRVLVIGAGTERYEGQAEFVYTDVSLSSGLDAICDAHDLPFGDAQFDLVLSIAVLEHVADPQRVVGEIWRVLKPDAWVFAVTPFLQPVHMGAHDFTRFTHLGHRRLFRHFIEVESGMALGPGYVVGASIRSLLVCLSFGKASRQMFNLLGVFVSVPFKLLDLLFKASPAALDGAGGVFFIGRKSDHAVSDRALMSLYRGGF